MSVGVQGKETSANTHTHTHTQWNARNVVLLVIGLLLLLLLRRRRRRQRVWCWEQAQTRVGPRRAARRVPQGPRVVLDEALLEDLHGDLVATGPDGSWPHAAELREDFPRVVPVHPCEGHGARLRGVDLAAAQDADRVAARKEAPRLLLPEVRRVPREERGAARVRILPEAEARHRHLHVTEGRKERNCVSCFTFSSP